MSSVSKQTLPDGGTQWTLDGGATVTLRRLAPGVMYFAASGSITAFIDEAAKALDAEIAKEGRITVFANLYETARMASDVRDAWANWSKKSKASTAPYCLGNVRIANNEVPEPGAAFLLGAGLLVALSQLQPLRQRRRTRSA